jgi:hypothetical protein
MPRITTRLAAVLLLGLAAPGASAQTDLLKRGQELLGGSGTTAPASTPDRARSLSPAEMGSGLKEALRVGTDTVVAKLGKADAFNGDPAIHIPLPKSMQTVQQTLGKLGMSGMLDDLETRINHAAEAATPKAKDLFVNAIQTMTLRDAFRPSVDQALNDAGAVKAYDNVMGSYKSVPFVPDVKTDLTNDALDGAIAGIFLYLAKEEASIRADPAKRTTDLLKKVFGG